MPPTNQQNNVSVKYWALHFLVSSPPPRTHTHTYTQRLHLPQVCWWLWQQPSQNSECRGQGGSQRCVMVTSARSSQLRWVWCPWETVAIRHWYPGWREGTMPYSHGIQRSTIAPTFSSQGGRGGACMQVWILALVKLRMRVTLCSSKMCQPTATVDPFFPTPPRKMTLKYAQPASAAPIILM